MDNPPLNHPIAVRRRFSKRVKDSPPPTKGISVVRSGKELVKTGMIASATAMVLTGFRIVKPLNPLHRFAGVAFLGFSLWHVVQSEKIVKKNLSRRAWLTAEVFLQH